MREFAGLPMDAGEPQVPAAAVVGPCSGGCAGPSQQLTGDVDRRIGAVWCGGRPWRRWAPRPAEASRIRVRWGHSGDGQQEHAVAGAGAARGIGTACCRDDPDPDRTI